MTPDELIERYNRGQRDFPWTNLQGQTFDRVQLADLVLTRANLSETHWHAAHLDRLKGVKLEASHSQFVGASLCSAKLYKANLVKVNFQNAKLAQADLSGAVLTGANLSGADLSQATLDRADLRGASLQGAIWDQTRAVSVLFDETTIAPDGSDWASWQAVTMASNPAEASAIDDHASEPPPLSPWQDLSHAEIIEKMTDPRRTFMPRVLSLQNYRPEIIRFSARDLRRRSSLDNLSLTLLASQGLGYGLLGVMLGAYGLPAILMLILALSIVGWRWDRQLTLVAPLLAIVTTLALLIPLAGLLFIGIILGIIMLVLTFNFILQYGLLEGVRNAVWIGCWALLFLLGMNGIFAMLGGAMNVWSGLITLLGGTLVTTSSCLWIDLAQRGYSERQALQICGLCGSGSLILGWVCAALLVSP